MTTAQLEPLDDGVFAVRGELNRDSVTMLLRQARQQFARQPPQRIDLAAVSRTDSAGVALLVEWLRQARAADHALRFVNVPRQMRAIIEVSGLEALLSLD